MRSITTKRKLESKHRFLRFLGLIPLIQFIGVSSVAGETRRRMMTRCLHHLRVVVDDTIFILLISSLVLGVTQDTKSKTIMF